MPENQLPEGWARPLPERAARPTYWPAALALGAVFTLWGPVTTYIVSAVGIALGVVALVGWIGEARRG